MKTINFTFKISLIFLTLLSCNNEQLEQENQQEFFEITNLETGEIISVYDIEVKMISDNNSDNLDFLSIKGSTNIDDSFLCVEIFLLLSPEIVGFYTNDEELIMQSTSTCDGGIFAESDFDGGMYLDIQELAITDYGDVGELIHMNFNGGYWLDGQHLMTANLQVYRDE